VKWPLACEFQGIVECGAESGCKSEAE